MSDMDGELLKDVAMPISFLESREKYYQGSETLTILKDDILCLKLGLEFLARLILLQLGDDLAHHMRYVVAYVKQKLASEEGHGSVTYTDLREKMRSLVIQSSGGQHKFVGIFQNGRTPENDFLGINDLLLEFMERVLMKVNWDNEHDDQTAGLIIKLQELMKTLICLKPLCAGVTEILGNSTVIDYGVLYPLDIVLSGAARVIYLVLISKMDELVPLLLSRGNRFPILYDRNDSIKGLYFEALLSISPNEEQFYILNNLIKILESNRRSFNNANRMLYEKLTDLRICVTSENEYKRLNNFLGVSAATEAICFQAIPILCSCYAEKTGIEVDFDGELNDAIVDIDKRIKHIKSVHNSQEIELYDYPRIDGLGFLEFFSSGQLKNLQGNQQISVLQTGINALYTNLCWFISFVKTSPQEKHRNDELWDHIFHLAYKAEYIIDLYLVIPNDSRYITTLSSIVEQVVEIKEKVVALSKQVVEIKEKVAAQDDAIARSGHVFGTPPQANNTLLVGFKREISAITECLLERDKQLSFISVVGMAGAGKTSLAMHLFNSPQITPHFEHQAWCTVPQGYEKRELLLSILNQLNKNDNDSTKLDDEDLADKICRSLKKFKYFVVIDDMWDIDTWKNLRGCFPNDEKGSRILITTRNENVASKINPNVLKLHPLTNDESWELLHSKLSVKEILPDNLLGIAKGVAESCKGLPLSIVVIAGVLLNEDKTEEIWSKILANLNSIILSQSEEEGGCKGIIELSYNHLSDGLRSCFLYLGAFPGYQEISVTCLARLYVAEGLAQGSNSETAEDVAERYINSLIFRCLVMPLKVKPEGRIKTLRLHDLLHAFCLDKAKEEHFLTMLDPRGVIDPTIGPRRIIIERDFDKYLPLIIWQSVRSIMLFSNIGNGRSEIERIIKSQHTVLLNVLHINAKTPRPSYISNLVHLRYLDIQVLDRDQSLIRSAIIKLWNLKILILTFSEYAFEVPDAIWNLVKLRSVHILPSAFFPQADISIQPLLENLQSLSKIDLCHGNSKWLSEVKHLQKLSCRFFQSWDASLRQYRFPDLALCIRLTSLKVELGVELDTGERCKLHFPVSLRKLSLSKFKMVSDDISEIGNSLPNLEFLKLKDCIDKWDVSDDDFPSLKVLKLMGGGFNEWDVSEGSFPLLEQLLLEGCHSLEKIPDPFEDKDNLRLISVKNCSKSVDESAREIERLQNEQNNAELVVNIYPRLQENVDSCVCRDKYGCICHGCRGKIDDEHYLVRCGRVWHQECLQCHVCNQPFSDNEVMFWNRGMFTVPCLQSTIQIITTLNFIIEL